MLRLCSFTSTIGEDQCSIPGTDYHIWPAKAYTSHNIHILIFTKQNIDKLSIHL